MIVFHEDPKKTVAAIFNVVDTFLHSKRYHLQFVHNSRKVGKYQFHELQHIVLRKCLYEIHGMKLMDVRECMLCIVKMAPELQLLLQSANEIQKSKIQTLLDNCYRQLSCFYQQEKYPNRKAISSKPVINLSKVIEQQNSGYSRGQRSLIH